jgi:hypothetical protein
MCLIVTDESDGLVTRGTSLLCMRLMFKAVCALCPYPMSHFGTAVGATPPGAIRSRFIDYLDRARPGSLRCGNYTMRKSGHWLKGAESQSRQMLCS